MAERMTDDQLLRRYVETGSDEAVAELVRRHGDWVYSVCLRRVGNRVDLAEDAAQAVFVAMARKAGGLVGRRSLAGWLFETARFASLDIVKLERRRQKHETEAARMTAQRNSGIPDGKWDEVGPRIEPALDRLPGKYREPILLRFYQGRSHAEIARELAISEAAAEKRVSRAVERLAQLLRAERETGMTAPAVVSLLTAHAVTPAPATVVGGVAEFVRQSVLKPRVEALTKGILRMATVKKVQAVGTIAAVVAATCVIGVVVRPYWGGTTLAQATETAEAAPSPLVAEVPGGIKIELVGVCDAGAAGRPWWKADGTPMEGAPYPGAAGFSGGSMERIVKQAEEEGQVVREFALRVTQTPEVAAGEGADVECFVVPPAQRGGDGYAGNGGGGGSGAQVSKEVGPVRAVLARLKVEEVGATLRCRVSGGAWVTVLSAPAATGSPADSAAKGAAFGAAKESKGWTKFTYKTSRPAAGKWRLVAVDVEGKAHKAQIRGSRSFGGPDGTTTEMEAWVNLPAEKLKELQFQTRGGSDEWVEFHNVCVDPAKKTQPVVGGRGEKSQV